MAGLSAGSLCWFAEAMSGYHGECTPVRGMEFLPWSNAVHYDKEPHRRPAFHAALLAGMPGGFAAEDGAALHFVGEELARVVTSRPRRAPSASTPWAARWSSCRCRRRTSASPRSPPLPPDRGDCHAVRAARRSSRRARADDLRHGRGRLHDGAGEPGAGRVRARACTRRASRASACCPPPAATPRTRSAASTPPSPTSSASRRTCRCSGSARSRVPLREHLLAQDVVYVGGGSMINLLALWRAHGVDAILREAWQAGIVLAGLSAGSMCWFEHGITTSTGAPARGRRPRLPAGLELRPPRRGAGAAARVPRRRRARRRSRPAGASTTASACLFRGTRVAEAVTSRPGARAYRVHVVDGAVVEEAIEPRAAHALRPRGSRDAAGRQRAARVAGGPAGRLD